MMLFQSCMTYFFKIRWFLIMFQLYNDNQCGPKQHLTNLTQCMDPSPEKFFHKVNDRIFISGHTITLNNVICWVLT